MGDFVRGMDRLDQAEMPLNRGAGGEPPSGASLEQARMLIGTATELIGQG